MYLSLHHILSTLPFLTLILADCPMIFTSTPATDINTDFTYAIGDIVTTPQVCQSTGPGTITLGMVLQESSLGLTDSTSSQRYIVLMDNYCRLLGSYSFGDVNCDSKPFLLEADFLKYVVVLSTINTDIADPFFDFQYANGDFAVGENGCGCDQISNAVAAVVVGCKCAFPVDGELTKRGLGFVA